MAASISVGEGIGWDSIVEAGRAAGESWAAEAPALRVELATLERMSGGLAKCEYCREDCVPPSRPTDRKLRMLGAGIWSHADCEKPAAVRDADERSYQERLEESKRWAQLAGWEVGATASVQTKRTTKGWDREAARQRWERDEARMEGLIAGSAFRAAELRIEGGECDVAVSSGSKDRTVLVTIQVAIRVASDVTDEAVEEVLDTELDHGSFQDVLTGALNRDLCCGATSVSADGDAVGVPS